MQMRIKDGFVDIIEADATQFTIIKSWGKMKWDKRSQMFSGPVDIELLNRLAGITRLTPPVEAERQRLNEIAQAVDAERMKTDPEPLYKYPVKFPLFKHQTRAANMALITFGLVPPLENRRE